MVTRRPYRSRMRDGLWQVTTRTFVAGFVVEDGSVKECAPILRRRLGHWKRQAVWIAP
jgi:hypothetical protein